jgi:hypothetical protein
MPQIKRESLPYTHHRNILAGRGIMSGLVFFMPYPHPAFDTSVHLPYHPEGALTDKRPTPLASRMRTGQKPDAVAFQIMIDPGGFSPPNPRPGPCPVAHKSRWTLDAPKHPYL